MIDTRRRELPLFIGLTAYLAAVAVGVHLSARTAPLWLMLGLSAGLAGLVLLVRRSALPRRAIVVLVLAGGAMLQLAALTAGPTSSDDVYRYVWDGTVQLHGTDPYRYPPAAPQLEHDRSDLLFHDLPQCRHPIMGGCTAINRPTVRTVYPPIAQLIFDGVRLASFGGHGGVRPFQIAGALGSLLIGLMLARRALARGRPLWPVAVWTWSPLAVLEYGNNAHLDWAAAMLGLGALAAASRGRSALAGALIGAGTLTKLYPALVLPALLRRRPLAVLTGAAAVVVLGYAPHVAAVGARVIGYLPGYLTEEGYRSGSRLLLLGWIFPRPFDTVIGALLLGAVAVVAWRRADPLAPERTATWIVGAAFLVTTPAYGWYAGLLLVLALVSAQYEWLPLALAPSIVYLLGLETHTGVIAQRLVYLAAAVATGTAAAVRVGSPTAEQGLDSRSSDTRATTSRSA